ncbi:MAG TPA: ISAzo13 family transposase [Candidatus Dormibacteraeota bacterium]|nr:ISAzo13 family transposase [Candidatus Dormibacteraeota bacterium]
MDKETRIEQIRKRYALAAVALDERGRRRLAASEALTLGWGGVTVVAQATGLSRATIGLGIKEVRGAVASAEAGRVRRPGGGRKQLVAKDPSVLRDLEGLVEPTARGDPESPLRWTCKSVRTLAAALGRLGHQVSHQWVATALDHLGYSLQGNQKTREGGDHPDRDAQFAHISQTSQTYLAVGDPVISVDAKKKELVGDFKNGGRALLKASLVVSAAHRAPPTSASKSTTSPIAATLPANRVPRRSVNHLIYGASSCAGAQKDGRSRSGAQGTAQRRNRCRSAATWRQAAVDRSRCLRALITMASQPGPYLGGGTAR